MTKQITFVGASGLAAAGLAGTTGLLIPKIGAAVTGDLLVLTMLSGSNDATPTDSGWTTIEVQAGSPPQGGTYWRYANTATDPANWTVSRSNNLTSTGFYMVALRGVHPVNPIENFSHVENTAASSTTAVLPSITMTKAKYLLQMVLNLNNATAMTAPSGTTKDSDAAYTSGNFEFATGHDNPAAGSTGSRTWTLNTTSAIKGFMAGIIPASQEKWGPLNIW